MLSYILLSLYTYTHVHAFDGVDNNSTAQAHGHRPSRLCWVRLHANFMSNLVGVSIPIQNLSNDL
jgi:hypothetical protein